MHWFLFSTRLCVEPHAIRINLIFREEYYWLSHLWTSLATIWIMCVGISQQYERLHFPLVAPGQWIYFSLSFDPCGGALTSDCMGRGKAICYQRRM